jgi:hypothetical protein
MVKIEVQFDGEEHPRSLDVKNPKGKDINKYWDYMTKVGQDAANEDLTMFNEFRVWLDEKAAKLAGLSVDQLNDLDIEYKETIMDNFVGKAKKTMGFMKP